MAVVLDTALLWAVFDASSNVYLPAEMLTRVRTAYKHIPTRQLDLAEDPVKKVELLVTSFKGDVYINELELEMEEGEAGEDGEAAVE